MATMPMARGLLMWTPTTPMVPMLFPSVPPPDWTPSPRAWTPPPRAMPPMPMATMPMARGLPMVFPSFHWTGPHYPGSGPRDSGLCSLLWLWPHWSLLWLIREERRTYIVIYLLGICCYTTDTENYSVPFTLWMGRDKENKEN